MKTAHFRRILLGAAALVASGLTLVGCGEDGSATAQEASGKPLLLVQADVCYDGDAGCAPTGAHAKHGGYACAVCHKVAGRLVFDSTGPAYAPGATGAARPFFDAATKTCSNVACHSMPAGTFSYYFPGGDGEPELFTVNYGGGPARVTPSWYATGGVACSGCHDNPPRNGSDGSNAWHSGFHAGGPTSANNQCQLCHPNAAGVGGVGTTITNAALHGNGVVNVSARFTSACFGCH